MHRPLPDLVEVLQRLHGVFDLDIHAIPARKDFPQHDHYDVRYLVNASLNEKIIVSEESHDVKWVMLNELEKFSTEVSLLRMRDKALAINKLKQSSIPRP